MGKMPDISTHSLRKEADRNSNLKSSLSKTTFYKYCLFISILHSYIYFCNYFFLQNSLLLWCESPGIFLGTCLSHLTSVQLFKTISAQLPRTPVYKNFTKLLFPLPGSSRRTFHKMRPSKEPDVRLSRIRLFTKRIIQQLSFVYTDIHFSFG